MLTATAHRQPLVVLVLLIVVPTRLLIEVLSYVDLRVWICAAAPGNYYCCHHFLLQIIHYLLIIDRGSLANCRIEYCCMFLSLALTPPRPSRSKQSWCLELHKEVHPFNRLSHCCVLIIPQLYTHYSSHSRHLSNTASDDNSILPAVLISIMDALSNILHTYHATLLVSMHRLRLPPLSSTFDFEVLLTTWHHDTTWWKRTIDSSEANIAIDFAQPGSLAYHLKQHNRISFSSSTTPPLYTCSFSLLMCNKLYTIIVLSRNLFKRHRTNTPDWAIEGLLMVRMTSFRKLLCCFNNYYRC